MNEFFTEKLVDMILSWFTINSDGPCIEIWIFFVVELRLSMTVSSLGNDQRLESLLIRLRITGAINLVSSPVCLVHCTKPHPVTRRSCVPRVVFVYC